MAEETIHGCALVCGRQGILITGASGSGKSTLGHRLVQQNPTAIWVTDDRVVLKTSNGALIASVPKSLTGRVERPFLGIEAVSCLAAARIDLVVDLISAEDLDRMPEEILHTPLITGPAIPVLKAPKRSASLSCQLIIARLSQL